MAETWIALLRGINVGKAKRIAMADLRSMIAELGFSDVRTLLNSGNAVFKGKGKAAMIARKLEQAIEDGAGFRSRVVVVSADELDAVIDANPLAECDENPSRFLVGFVSGPAALERLEPLIAQRWAPDRLVLGDRAAYLWCASGINESPLVNAFSKAAGEEVTSRNWATVLKLRGLAKAG